ncbi:MAG: PhnD/SsuA/transferrin family substrate-binding protein [Silicimonas sp.]|nr:PhnD/SsuA/transferrin family substrate-binding protein [Silicimonas sp.]
MIASLPMYDRPETMGANDRLWSLIRANLPEDIPAPEHLTRSADPMSDWTAANLLFSQTCSLPYRARLRDHLQIVGTPVHDLDAPPGSYYSVLVARADDPREAPEAFAGARLAVNDPLSQSGWAAIHSLGVPFGISTITGAHGASAEAVAGNRADLAAIDAVTWTLLTRHGPRTGALRVIARTPPSPALPYVTATGEAERLGDALSTAISQLSDDDRKALCLKGLTHLSRDVYLDQPIPPAPV